MNLYDFENGKNSRKKPSLTGAGISKKKETEFHAKLDTLVHNTFGKREEEFDEGTIYDLEKEYGYEKAPAKRYSNPQGAIPRDPADDSYSGSRAERALRADQERVKKAWADHLAKQKEQGVAEGSLNELAPGGSEGNGPFEYGSSIVSIGQDFIDNYTDSAAGEDAADIIEVGKTFMSAGMTAGIAALFAIDTQVYQHVLNQLSNQGFNVKGDIIAKRQRPSVSKSAQAKTQQMINKFNAEPGNVYLVTGHHEFGSTANKLKASGPQEAKQKFIATHPDEKFSKVDVKQQGVAEGSLNEFAEKPEDGPGSDDYEDLLFHLAWEIWSEAGDSAQAERKLSLLGWKPEFGDDYTAMVLYKIGSNDHRQYTIDDFEEYGEQGVAEAKAATAAFRAGDKKRAKLNSMSDEERRAYDKEQQENQRKRDDARLERERNKNKGVAEGEEMGTFAALKDWQVWNVHVFNNYYRGKYADYGPRPYSVVAGSPEEARQVVINNPDYVLQDLLSRKLQNGKKVLPRSSALPVEEKRVGKAEPGSITTMGLKKMLTPDGVQSFKFTNGKIVDGSHAAGGEEPALSELSNELLGDYKKELGVRASAADKAGDYDKGHEYFKKINKATIRQGENDARRAAEKEKEITESRLEMMRRAGYDL